MAAFKDEFSPALVDRLGRELTVGWAGFPHARWVELANDGLDELELLERVDHLAAAMVACMPPAFAEAAAVIDGALASDTFTGWMTLPCGKYVADAGIDHPHVAIPLLGRMTHRFSSEFPIRFFIEAHPEITFTYLHEWTGHPDEHVRRLVSEGTRPRLPWASQLRSLREDPTPAIDLLDMLYDDESEYVRRSVANHLNDISKDHPELAVEIANRWLAASTNGDWVARHGLRSLVKQGHRGALAALGFDLDVPVRATKLRVEPAELAIGESVTITSELTADRPTKAAIDYVVHFQGVTGAKAGKVFKLTTRTLGPEPTLITKRHTFRHVSIRTIHPGPHRIELQVNGIVVAEGVVDVAN